MTKGNRLKRVGNQFHIFYFVLGVIAINLICFFSKIGEMDGNSVSVVEVIIHHYEELRCQTTWLDAFYSALYGWLILLLPVITAVAVTPLFCDEMKSQNYQLHIIRIGFGKYISGHFFSAFLTGFVLVVIALSIYVLCVVQLFPSVHDFGNMLIEGYEEMTITEMLRQIMVKLLQYGLIGGMLGVLSSVFVAFTRNIYINLALSFLVNYLFRNWLLMANIGVLFTLVILLCLAGYFVWYIKYRRLAL